MAHGKKDFLGWNTLKTVAHEEKARPFCHEREIWFCALGLNIGYEQDGRGESFLRPAVVLKKFNNEMCWIVPLTKTQKQHKYYFNFVFDSERPSSAILSQLRLVDIKRLVYKRGDMSKVDFEEIKKRLRDLLL